MPKMMKRILGLAVLGLAPVLINMMLTESVQAAETEPADKAPVIKAEGKVFKDGSDFRTLKRPVMTDASGGKIEVASVFWYGCPHCYSLEPIVGAWSKKLPEDVYFVRRPGFFGPNLWQTHAQLYFTIHNMGLEDKVHEGIFNEVQNKRNYLKNSDAMADFLNKRYGVEKEKFIRQFNSFGVNSQLQQASAKLKGYDLTGVPALIIDGRYVVEPGLAGSLDNMPVIAEFLIAKVQKDRKAKIK